MKTVDRWEIRTEFTIVNSLRFCSGESGLEMGMRVLYRPAGARGRFRTFIVVDPFPKRRQLQRIVTTYNAKHGPAAWRKVRMVSRSSKP